MTSRIHRSDIVRAVTQFVSDADRRGRRYESTVAEHYEHMIADCLLYVRERAVPPLPTVTRSGIESAIRSDETLSVHPSLSRRPAYASNATLMEDGYDASAAAAQLLYDEDTMIRRRREIVNSETERVLDDVRGQLRTMLADGSYKRFSNPIDNEFMAAVSVQYPVAVAEAVEHEVALNYQRAISERRLHRPYLTAITRFNVREPLRREPKRVFCSMFFFHFLRNPEAVVVPEKVVTENNSTSTENMIAVPIEMVDFKSQ